MRIILWCTFTIGEREIGWMKREIELEKEKKVIGQRKRKKWDRGNCKGDVSCELTTAAWLCFSPSFSDASIERFRCPEEARLSHHSTTSQTSSIGRNHQPCECFSPSPWRLAIWWWVGIFLRTFSVMWHHVLLMSDLSLFPACLHTWQYRFIVYADQAAYCYLYPTLLDHTSASSNWGKHKTAKHKTYLLA